MADMNPPTVARNQQDIKVHNGAVRRKLAAMRVDHIADRYIYVESETEILSNKHFNIGEGAPRNFPYVINIALSTKGRSIWVCGDKVIEEGRREGSRPIPSSFVCTEEAASRMRLRRDIKWPPYILSKLYTPLEPGVVALVQYTIALWAQGSKLKDVRGLQLPDAEDLIKLLEAFRDHESRGPSTTTASPVVFPHLVKEPETNAPGPIEGSIVRPVLRQSIHSTQDHAKSGVSASDPVDEAGASHFAPPPEYDGTYSHRGPLEETRNAEDQLGSYNATETSEGTMAGTYSPGRQTPNSWLGIEDSSNDQDPATFADQPEHEEDRPQDTGSTSDADDAIHARALHFASPTQQPDAVIEATPSALKAQFKKLAKFLPKFVKMKASFATFPQYLDTRNAEGKETYLKQRLHLGQVRDDKTDLPRDLWIYFSPTTN